MLLIGIVFFSLGYGVNAGEEPRYAYTEDESFGVYQDRVSQDQIHVYNSRVELDLAGVKFAPISGTNSMLPLLHSGAHSLELDVEDVTTLKLGDIISYRNPYLGKMIIHSIVEIGVDDSGWYAITKGLSNDLPDEHKVRASWVEGVLIGVLY